MRIVRLFLAWFIGLSVLGGLGFLLLREVWLGVAVSQVRSHISSLNRTTLRAGEPAIECLPPGTPLDSEVVNVYQVQLTFIDDIHYQWELICDSPFRDPIVLSEYTLPSFVRKMPGSSGIVLGSPSSGFTLNLWGRQKAIVMRDRTVETISPYTATTQNLYSAQPVSVCAGTGYTCCSLDSEVGVGDQVTLARDCPRSCFAQCKRRPVVLSLFTQPHPETTAREISIQSGGEVTFSYVVDSATPIIAVLVFGDGDQYESQLLTDTVTHTYVCSSSSCSYTASLHISDQTGVTSAISAVNQMKIQVTGQ